MFLLLFLRTRSHYYPPLQSTIRGKKPGGLNVIKRCKEDAIIASQNAELKQYEFAFRLFRVATHRGLLSQFFLRPHAGRNK